MNNIPQNTDKLQCINFPFKSCIHQKENNVTYISKFKPASLTRKWESCRQSCCLVMWTSWNQADIWAKFHCGRTGDLVQIREIWWGDLDTHRSAAECQWCWTEQQQRKKCCKDTVGWRGSFQDAFDRKWPKEIKHSYWCGLQTNISVFWNVRCWRLGESSWFACS